MSIFFVCFGPELGIGGMVLIRSVEFVASFEKFWSIIEELSNNSLTFHQK